MSGPGASPPLRGRSIGLVVVLLLGVAALLAGGVALLNVRGEDPVDADGGPPAAAASAEQVARGAYLARAGNCQGCHTLPGGAAYGGGVGIATPFGTVYGPNLTPDPAHGLGRWSADHFWRALHNGRSRDGRLLYPVFPYPNYTRVTREDADALYAYLRSLPPAATPNRPPELGFPFDQQAALAVWRALYFRPGAAAPESGRSAEWLRGAYLVEGLGHCNACHSSRNSLGASAGPLDLGGGLIPVQNWYAPSLTSPAEAGVAGWPVDEVVRLLKSGINDRAVVLGPMAEVVAGSTQHLAEADLRAMTAYLQALPAGHGESAALSNRNAAVAGSAERGGRLYATHCAQCHGDAGEGVAGVYPRLAGNRAVTLDPPANLVHVVLEGGFPPATAGNPRPFGMPPFGNVLTNVELADLLSYVRSAWGNGAAGVTAVDVDRLRNGR